VSCSVSQFWPLSTRVAEPYKFDGFSSPDLAALLDLPDVSLFAETTSTLDVAHSIAAKGCPAGTLVIADQQTAGRGRTGSKWMSPGSSGIWLALIERPVNTSGLDVLSLRIGLRAARALDRFAAEPVRLKWPNDLFVEGRKLGGVLIEARWRESRLDWVAIGVGVNVSPPADFPLAGSLDDGTRRIEVLTELVPALRLAAAALGALSAIELAEWNARDLARGRHCREPARGVVEGITAEGELLVALADSVARFRTGSLILDLPS
jgi:BirA family transcriptional regulator, biotin operon repressor / biotin---[acetyl-CoA-carboxylase] ligase